MKCSGNSRRQPICEEGRQEHVHVTSGFLIKTYLIRFYEATAHVTADFSLRQASPVPYHGSSGPACGVCGPDDK